MTYRTNKIATAIAGDRETAPITAPSAPNADMTHILADELKRVRERCAELETALEASRRIRTQRDLEFEQLLGRSLKLEAELAAIRRAAL